MKRIEHTPGPWVINTEDGVCIDARLPDGRFVARVEADDSGSAEDGYVPFAEGMANARLISSSPELLAALEGILKHLKLEGEPVAGEVSVWSNARTAIAKARGD